MNIRKQTYFFLLRVIRGIQVGHYYDLYWREDQNGIPPHTTENYLEQMLTHCQKNVPYYAKLMKDLGDSYHEDPIGYLQRLPILTKAIIQENFQRPSIDGYREEKMVLYDFRRLHRGTG